MNIAPFFVGTFCLKVSLSCCISLHYSTFPFFLFLKYIFEKSFIIFLFMSKFYSFKKVDSRVEFDSLNCASKKYWNGDSVWAEMKFCNGTCYYFICVKGEKMQKLAVKMVRQYVMTDESCVWDTQVSKGKKSRF